MELIVKRMLDTHSETLDILFVEGKACFQALEDTFRHEKIEGETRIPAGRYPVTLCTKSAKAKHYKKKFGIEGIPSIDNVPGFDLIRIHIGNSKKDTEGCLLVGESSTMDIQNGNLVATIVRSTTAFLSFYKMIIEDLKKDNVFITFIDN